MGGERNLREVEGTRQGRYDYLPPKRHVHGKPAEEVEYSRELQLSIILSVEFTDCVFKVRASSTGSFCLYTT